MNKGLAKNEIVLIVAMLLPLPLMAIAKLWFLFGTFLTFYLCFGLYEYLSYKQTGDTITESFQNIREDSPVMFWLIIASMIFMWGALITHFVV